MARETKVGSERFGVGMDLLAAWVFVGEGLEVRTIEEDWNTIEGIKGMEIRRICSLLRFSAMIPSVGLGMELVGGGGRSMCMSRQFRVEMGGRGGVGLESGGLV